MVIKIVVGVHIPIIRIPLIKGGISLPAKKGVEKNPGIIWPSKIFFD